MPCELLLVCLTVITIDTAGDSLQFCPRHRDHCLMRPFELWHGSVNEAGVELILARVVLLCVVEVVKDVDAVEVVKAMLVVDVHADVLLVLLVVIRADRSESRRAGNRRRASRRRPAARGRAADVLRRCRNKRRVLSAGLHRPRRTYSSSPHRLCTLCCTRSWTRAQAQARTRNSSSTRCRKMSTVSTLMRPRNVLAPQSICSATTRVADLRACR